MEFKLPEGRNLGLFSQYHQQPCLATASTLKRETRKPRARSGLCKGQTVPPGPCAQHLRKRHMYMHAHTRPHACALTPSTHAHVVCTVSSAEHTPQGEKPSARSTAPTALQCWRGFRVCCSSNSPGLRGPHHGARAGGKRVTRLASRSRSTAPAQPLWRLVPTVGVAVQPSQALRGS